MAKIKAWTKQNKAVWRILQEEGRYTVDPAYVATDMEGQRNTMLYTYQWLTAHSPRAGEKPSDVSFPIWLSMEKDHTMIHEEGYVVLELEIDEERLAYINVAKWSRILNLAYIPADEADAKAHRQLLSDYNTNDVKAFTTPFYPQIKNEIIESWDRLWDPAVDTGGDIVYGLIWEMRREWITAVTE
ncbi:MAG: DUF3841 domain-containing protein [Firmicutes bacterium]|nr:DUF3841 domain-containing protein [Bacillota bacterium]